MINKNDLLQERSLLIDDIDRVNPENMKRYEEIQLMLLGLETLEEINKCSK